MVNADPGQRQWLSAARRIRQVRRASLIFLDLWALSRVAAGRRAMDRFAADVDARAESALADPHNHDWSLLYRGSILDD